MATDNRGIAAANAAIRTDAVLGEQLRRRRRHARMAVAAVDELLGILEQRHLDGEARAVPIQPAWRRVLERGGQPIPVPVLTARSTVVLHERLLDWQDQLLNQLAPGRPTSDAAVDDPDATAVHAQEILHLFGRPPVRSSALPPGRTA
jgi:hypothetical protein